MKIHRHFSILRSILFFLSFLLTLTCAAQQPPAPHVVDLSAADGTKLKATFFAASKPGPGVLLLHQCNRQRKVWDDLARHLAASGLNVLTFDLRGFGDSAGTPIDKLPNDQIAILFKEKFPSDIQVAYSYLTSQPGVTAAVMAAGGASCGVQQAVYLAEHHPEISALVLLSEGTDAEGRQFLRNKGDMPLFLAVADDDPDLGVSEIMEWLYSFSSNPTNKFEHYKTGGHGVEMFAAHPQLPDQIVAWLGTSLYSPPAPQAKPKPGPSTPETRFLELIDQPGGPAIAAQVYAGMRHDDPKLVLFSEPLMNRLGYEHLQAGDNKGAIELLKLNVIAFPNSPNVYDSLSDAYLADGQKDLARQNAQKAIELLASDTTDPPDRRKGIQENAQQKLKQLAPSPD